MSTIRGAEQLLERNVETEILCIPGSKISKEALSRGIKIYTLNASGYFNPLQIFRLKKYLDKAGIDIIHSHASQDLWTLVPAMKLTSRRIPLLLTKRVGSFIVKKDPLHNFLYNNISAAIAISEVIKKNLIETTGLSPAKIKLIYNGIDVDKFNPIKVDGSEVRKEFNIPKDKFLIGFMGRFTWGKGHEEFIEAAEILSKEYNNLLFFIVGEASRDEEKYEQKIKELVHQKRLADKIIFTGYRKDTPNVLAAMDIFVFPSHSEAFGNALAEAMAMQKPTVASNSDGVLDIAVDGITTYLFENKNSVDLSEKIKLLLDNPETRKKFGKAGRERALEKFSRDKQTDKLIRLYENLIN